MGATVAVEAARGGVLGKPALRPAVEVEPELAPRFTLKLDLVVLAGGVTEESATEPVKLLLLALVFKLGILLVEAAAAAVAAPALFNMLERFSRSRFSLSRALAPAVGSSVSSFT